MKRIVFLIVFLIVAIAGLSFALMNAERVTLTYYFGLIEAPLSLVVVVAIAIGALLGVLASMSMTLSLKHEISRLRKTLRTKEKELGNLRALPLKDKH